MLITTNIVAIAHETHRRVWKGDHHDRCVDQAVEEMGELQSALMKIRRGRYVPREHILGEVADVLLCLDFILRDKACSLEEMQAMVGERAAKLDHKLSTHGARADL